MLILGIVLLVLGWLLGLQILWFIGLLLAVVGLVLLAASLAGHSVGGRRWY